MSLSVLPGELQEQIMNSIPLADIDTHLSFYHATLGAHIIYDEHFWRKLCFGNGIGGVWRPHSRPGQWRQTAQLVLDYRRERGCTSLACADSLIWASTNRQVLHATPESSTDFELNPVFSLLRLNWWSTDPLSTAFIESTDSQRWTPSLLDTHLASFAFATSPPVSTLEVDLSQHVPRSHGFAPLVMEREDGVRIRDVIAGIHRWMESSLPEKARRMLIARTKARDSETYELLEATTDEDTLDAFWSRKFRFQRDTISMRFSGLSLARSDSGLLCASVAFVEQEPSLTIASHIGLDDRNWFFHKLHPTT